MTRKTLDNFRERLQECVINNGRHLSVVIFKSIWKEIASYVLFISERSFCVPCFIWFLLTFKMWSYFCRTLYIWICLFTWTVFYLTTVGSHFLSARCNYKYLTCDVFVTNAACLRTEVKVYCGYKPDIGCNKSNWKAWTPTPGKLEYRGCGFVCQ